MTTKTKRNGELQSIPALFEKQWAVSQIEGAIKSFLDFLRGMAEKRYPDEKTHDSVPKAERQALGLRSFDAIVASIDTSSLSLFQKFLFWMSDWWYYDPRMREQVYFCLSKANEYINSRITEFMIPALPEGIRSVLSKMDVIGVATGFGHFAILFNDEENEIRRIVTDTELFEIRGVLGYNYINIAPDGKPFARCVTHQGGGRAFFDGVRLMSHDRFQTCAPKVAFFKGGYKVNSTQVTIVNGVLLPLIEEQDKVAHTTGAFMGMVDFSNTQAVESYRLTDETAQRLTVNKGIVHLDKKPLKPLGVFEPSRKQELDNGFTLYEYAEFRENTEPAYDHIMVVDDRTTWIEAVVEAFPEVKRVDRIETSNAAKALAAITTQKPEVVLLDMHLSDEERFEGLWIAREAKKAGYNGRILIASSYADEALQAMSVLTGGLEAPGKNLERIKKLLAKRK